MEPELKRKILSIVQGGEGRRGWHFIAHTLEYGYPTLNVITSITILIQQGLVASTGDVQSASTVYFLTEKGRELLKNGDPDLIPRDPDRE